MTTTLGWVDIDEDLMRNTNKRLRSESDTVIHAPGSDCNR